MYCLLMSWIIQFYVGFELFSFMLFSDFLACPNIGKLSNSVLLGQQKTKTFFSFQFDKKAMIVKFEELDDERQKEAKLVR